MVKLEKGKYYRTRDGRKVGPMVMNFVSKTHPFSCQNGYIYKVDGGYLIENHEHVFDIIAEWGDEPASPVRTVTRKEIVPGVYGHIWIESHDVEAGVVLFGLCNNALKKLPAVGMSLPELRAAIATLTEIADAMEEQ